MSFQSYHGAPLDDERGLVAHLIQAATEAGVQASAASIVNFYVALKSKPLTILAGPAGSGKIALVNSLARVLTGGDSFQYQAMAGHAWWAAQTGNVALFTEGQMRLNTLFMIGTMDTPWFDWWDEDLLSRTTVIRWPAVRASSTFPTRLNPISNQPRR